jgi:hypothetical protein
VMLDSMGGSCCKMPCTYRTMTVHMQQRSKHISVNLLAWARNRCATYKLSCLLFATMIAAQ